MPIATKHVPRSNVVFAKGRIYTNIVNPTSDLVQPGQDEQTADLLQELGHDNIRRTPSSNSLVRKDASAANLISNENLRNPIEEQLIFPLLKDSKLAA